MPHLRFRGVDEATLCAISQPLVDQLAALVTTSRDNFTLELLTNPFVFDGQRLTPEPMVQVPGVQRVWGSVVRHHHPKVAHLQRVHLHHHVPYAVRVHRQVPGPAQGPRPR